MGQHVKDVRMVLAASVNCGATLPLSILRRQLLELAESREFGASDNSAIIESFR